MLRALIREILGTRPVRRRRGGPRLRRMAEVAIVYWELFRSVDWEDGKLRARAGRASA